MDDFHVVDVILKGSFDLIFIFAEVFPLRNAIKI
jgi:hypothetical protein